MKNILLHTFVLFSLGISQSLYINEFLACNLINTQDEFGEYDDWIEIYNSSNNPVNISGYYITDNLNELTKWKLPQSALFSISPGEYLILWADSQPYQGDKHLSFSLDKNGEEIALIDLDGESIIDQIIYGYQQSDISMGRNSINSNDLSFFISPSLGVENGVSYQGFAGAPDFFPTGGHFDQSQMVIMSFPHNEHTLHYTLDLSDPTEDDPLYISGIDIINTSVLRARTLHVNFIPSSITSHIYLINESYSLPVLAILTNPENFWNDTEGIYVNYNDEGISWERRCTNQYLIQDSLHFSLDSGIRIQGSSSRVRQKKSFRLYYKKAYEKDRLLYPLFGISGPTSFKNLVLRAGYDDDIQMPYGTLLRDQLGSELWNRMGMLVSRGNFANLYLNDQYWGIYNIRESINEDFIRDHTGYLEFDLMRYTWEGQVVNYGTRMEWESLKEFMYTSDFTKDSVFVEATNLIDMENYLNFQALIICSQYVSWTHGVSAYREQNPLGKWRWTLWDMDRAFTEVNWNGFAFLNDTTDHYAAANIFTVRLLENEQFKTNYINRIADFLNSIFLSNNVISIIDSLAAIITPDISNEANRWEMPVAHWESNVDKLKLFAENRPSIVRQQILNYFSLSDSLEIIIDSNEGGHVQINSLLLNQYPWTGIYFQGIPINITAIPNKGYQFVNWHGISGEISNFDTISVVLMSDSTITAVFAVDPLNNESVKFKESLPNEYVIYHTYPNPFNPITTIAYAVPQLSKISINIYDMLGREIDGLYRGYKMPGYHSITWNASSYPSGVYLIRMESDEFTQTQKVLLIK